MTYVVTNQRLTVPHCEVMDEPMARAAAVDDDPAHVTVQLVAESGDRLGAPLHVPLKLDTGQLSALCNGLLRQSESDSGTDGADEPVPFTFYLKNGDVEIESDLERALDKASGGELHCAAESVVDITYQPQAVFRVLPVARCTSSLPGHGEPIISVHFSPCSRRLASGSGDCTVRLWDLSTELPLHTLRAHKHWVLCVAWAPDGRRLASACKNGGLCVWDGVSGAQLGRPMTGHKQWITALAWQPLHDDPQCRLLASSGKDTTVRIWDTTLCQCVRTLSGHTAAVTCVQWGGAGLIYSASQDRTLKVWRAADGVLCRTLAGHAHWVNTMALNTNHVLRTGAFEPKEAASWPKLDEPNEADQRDMALRAKRRYDAVVCSDTERLVSGSDDFTLFLWRPAVDKKPVARMTGHMQLVNQVVFSPDGRTVASASFDKSVKLWCGRTGRYLTSLRGHVQAVYQVAFSADSRLVVSASKDSTLKVWRVREGALLVDLPGHADEVYAVDWSTDGQRVASGSKDKLLRIWRR